MHDVRFCPLFGKFVAFDLRICGKITIFVELNDK